MNQKTILILGAKSDIGIAVARIFAQNGFDVYLASRNSKTLINYCNDINIRYNVSACFFEFDAVLFDTHENFVSSLPILPDVVLSAVGYLGNQKESELDFRKALLVIKTNYLGIENILSLFANQFEKRGSGTLIGISSVAGDRGRSSNYIYGSAKAGLSAYLSGLRNRLYKKGVNVITVKPGFVLTKMTSNLNLNILLTTNPTKVSRDIYKAYQKKKDIIYVTKIWSFIMIFIRLIPEKIFKKLSL